MGHRDDCLSPDYARERGREDWRSGWYSPYAQGDCHRAQEAYDEGMREERRYEQRRREAREQAEAEEAYYWQQQQEHDAMEAEMNAAMESDYATAMYFEEQEYLWLRSFEEAIRTSPGTGGEQGRTK